jgi:hypothetical protein
MYTSGGGLAARNLMRSSISIFCAVSFLPQITVHSSINFYGETPLNCGGYLTAIDCSVWAQCFGIAGYMVLFPCTLVGRFPLYSRPISSNLTNYDLGQSYFMHRNYWPLCAMYNHPVDPLQSPCHFSVQCGFYEDACPVPTRFDNEDSPIFHLI